MTAAIPQVEPLEFRAGDTLHWQRELDDYLPGDGWTLKYVAVTTGQQITITATVVGTIYDIFLTSSATAAFNTGRWHWQAYVTRSPGGIEERYTVSEGDWDIYANLATVTGGVDSRSHAKKVLDALEAMIEGKASIDQQEYTIHGRSLKRLSPAELIQWRSFYKNEYAREVTADRIAQGLGARNKLVTRFLR